MAPGFPASDSRACKGSTEPLEDKARDVGLALPKNAEHLAYLSSDRAPYQLALSFSVDATDLRQWLAANKLPTPKPDLAAGAVGAPCGSVDLEDALADPVAASVRLRPAVRPVGPGHGNDVTGARGSGFAGGGDRR